jgi:outer membrane protein TolC
LAGDAAPFAIAPPPNGRPEIPPIATLIETAMSYRPDLRSAELQVNARAAKAKWDRSRVLTFLAPTLNAKEVGNNGVLAGPGLNMDIPLNRNKGMVSRADAETVQAALIYAALKARVDREVLDARQAALGADAALALSAAASAAAGDAAEMAVRAHRIGEISQLVVLEAQRSRQDALLRELAALAAVERSRAELDRAVGRNL